ncbi:MAG: phosphatidate cytidylyltransferase [Rhodobacteraceae bacterium]|nr:phosphatidate cytidylyltransferase [Paracoccaceae bacterium]MCW9043982.1 phosphatidate cytidylyltransferase [Pseudopelagicola sp.]
MTGVNVVQLAWVAVALLASGLLLLGGLMLTPRGRPLAKSLAGSAASMVLTMAVLFGAFLGGPWTLGAFLLLLAARVGYEAGEVRLGAGKGIWVAVASLGTLALAMSGLMAVVLLAGLWMVLLGRYIGLPWQGDTRFKKLTELALFPVLPLALLSFGAMDEGLRPIMLVAYILIETFDSYALVVGKLFGKRPAFPVLSPRKTIEGLLGGAVFLVLTVVVVAAVMDASILFATALALLAGILGLAGDLAASRLKRRGGVKDFPVVLGHQGGALDIFDSWIAAGAGISLVIVLAGLT